MIRELKLPGRQEVLIKLKSTGIYLLVPIVNFGVSVITSPIFARYLTAEEFGYFGYYNSLNNLFTVFFSLSFQTYYMSIYYKGNSDERKKTLVTLVIFLLIWNIVFLPTLYLSIYLFFKYSSSQIPFYPFALLTFSAGAFGIFKNFLQVNFRLGDKPLSFFFIVSGYKVISITISIYFVVYLNMRLEGRMVGILLVEALFFLISLFHIFYNSSFDLDKKVLKHAIKIVLPLFPASLLYIPIINFDNIVLARLNNPAEMGIFNIGKGIATYLYTALFPFYQAFEPDIYKYAVTKNIKSLKKVIIFLLLIVIISVIAFWIISPYIIYYLTAGKYTSAVKYANLLVITNGLMIVFSIFDAIINALQETKKHLLINAITALLCIFTYMLGGIYFKQLGVAVASVITYFFLVLFQGFFILKKYKSGK